MMNENACNTFASRPYIICCGQCRKFYLESLFHYFKAALGLRWSIIQEELYGINVRVLKLYCTCVSCKPCAINYSKDKKKKTRLKIIFSFFYSSFLE